MAVLGVGVWQWALLAIVAYSAIAIWADQRGLLPDAVGAEGPFLTLHTQRGIALLDRIGSPKRAWRAWGNAGVGVALVVMAGAFTFLALSAVAVVRNPPPATSLNQPRNVLVIPGVNDFLPLSVAPEIVAGLLIGLVVHEGGHGLLCRVEDIDIDSVGLVFLAFVPVGAFVEPDEESRDRCDRGGQTRMFAGGVMNNFAIAAVGFALFFGPVVGAIAVAPGAPVADVYPGSPAERAGIASGDRITGVAGERVADRAALGDALANASDPRTRVEIDNERTVTVRRRVLVASALADGPVDLPVNATIREVNGTPVGTQAAFQAAIADRPIARLNTSNGTRTAPMGAAVSGIESEGALAAAGVAPESTIVVTHVNGDRVTDGAAFVEAVNASLSGGAGGSSGTTPLDLRLAIDRSLRTVTLQVPADASSIDEALGATVEPGTSGLVLVDLGVRLYPAAEYLALLGGSGGSFDHLTQSPIGRAFVALFLPVASFFPGLSENFAGFTGTVASFYVVEGALAPYAGLVFGLANLLFWTAWINLQLGFFNCIPGYPLDGGHILRTSTEAVVSRLPVDPSRSQVRTVTVSVGLTMLLSLLVTLFGPQLL
jgi:membrane-associated protease RseP (regulator of RpoE activity)